jgi:hypothetical protein
MIDTNIVLQSILSGAVVGIIVVIATYFMRKTAKVDDLPEKYATKVEVDKIREKMETFLSKDSCKAIREDCVGRNWVEAVQRLEDVFTRKFDELNTLLLSIMRDIGYSKGKQDTKK